MTPQERSQLGAYLSFLGGLAVFLLLFIPALFFASAVGVVAASVLMLAALLLSLWFGARGFGTSPSSEPVRASSEARVRVPLDPGHTEFDDENWLRVHGGPGTTPEHRDDLK